MDKPMLDEVFAGPPEGDLLPDEAPLPTDDPVDEESEQALDDSIDELFTSEDPVARREAFKRAITLCNSQKY